MTDTDRVERVGFLPGSWWPEVMLVVGSVVTLYVGVRDRELMVVILSFAILERIFATVKLRRKVERLETG